jgi:hypothetical protein
VTYFLDWFHFGSLRISGVRSHESDVARADDLEFGRVQPGEYVFGVVKRIGGRPDRWRHNYPRIPRWLVQPAKYGLLPADSLRCRGGLQFLGVRGAGRLLFGSQTVGNRRARLGSALGGAGFSGFHAGDRGQHWYAGPNFSYHRIVEHSVGFNYYLYGHNAKLQTAYSYLTGDTFSDKGFAANRVWIQAQVMF